MSAEFDISRPSIRRIHSALKQKERVAIKLLTDDQFVGTVEWIDPQCLSLLPDSGSPVLIWQQAIAFMRVME